MYYITELHRTPLDGLGYRTRLQEGDFQLCAHVFVGRTEND